MITGRDILYISCIDWNFVWHGPQEIAKRFADAGNRVLYVENMGVRSPTARDAARVVEAGRADAHVLDVEDAVARGGEAAGDLLMPLPVEIPLDAGDDNDVTTAKHKKF